MTRTILVFVFFYHHGYCCCYCYVLSSLHVHAPQVSVTKRVGVSSSQWRNWLLQMITFLSNQNGSVLDAVLMWKQNIDKRFEGVEDCTICYSVIHGTNCQLPNQRCKTCKNAFHSACLFKWFSTSNQSTCPLCRNLF
eukprot:m.145265 g.145265  ORF g.145265 m.145265 type:complete len:137 (-) comp24272_c0_seq2:38-448(-)